MTITDWRYWHEKWKDERIHSKGLENELARLRSDNHIGGKMTAAPDTLPSKLWLWKNGDHYWAFDNEYPCYPGGDPRTLGEPVAVIAIAAATTTEGK